MSLRSFNTDDKNTFIEKICLNFCNSQILSAFPSHKAVFYCSYLKVTGSSVHRENSSHKEILHRYTLYLMT